MTIIVAKFPSWCDTCGGRIEIGDKIAWERGVPTVHAACPVTSQSQRMAGHPHSRCDGGCEDACWGGCSC